MLMLECLESRRMLANTFTAPAPYIQDGVLYVTGTNHQDDIQLSVTSRNGNTGNDLNFSVTVTTYEGINSKGQPVYVTSKFNGHGKFSTVQVNGLQGQDTLEQPSSFTLSKVDVFTTSIENGYTN